MKTNIVPEAWSECFSQLSERATSYGSLNVGKISSMEVLKFLRENGVEEATEADTFYIVKYFDSNEDELLDYDDLLQILMPCDD